MDEEDESLPSRKKAKHQVASRMSFDGVCTKNYKYLVPTELIMNEDGIGLDREQIPLSADDPQHFVNGVLSKGKDAFTADIQVLLFFL